MSDYVQKEGQGTLRRNDKGDNPKRPDYWGSLTVGGVEYKLSAWINKSDSGSYMSLKAQPKGERQAPPRRDDDPPHVPPFEDELLPF